MVFLRLTVKVYPPDELHAAPDVRNRNDSSQSSSMSAAGKPANFMLVLEHPEEITLRGLSSMIQEKWKKLMPDVGPLDIKKLLDDSYESDELDIDMTVADVFVDKGRARADGSDQRGTVRVIQKPAPYAPVRYPSVTQDWGAGAEDFDRQLRTTNTSTGKLSTILEEPQRTPDSDPYTSRWPASSDPYGRAKERPLPSTEKDEIPASPEEWGGKSLDEISDAPGRRASMMAATLPQNRLESQELVDWAAPVPFPTHQGQQSTSSDRFIGDPALANESFIMLPDESTHEPNSVSPLSTRKTSSRAEQEFIPAPNNEASQESQSSAVEDEQDDSEHERVDSPSPTGKVSPHALQTVSDDEEPQDSHSSSDEDEQDCDSDGDIAMTASDAKGNGQAAKSIRSEAKVRTPNDIEEPKSRLSKSTARKRKNSQENLQARKEPRLSQVDSLASSAQTNRQTPSPQKLVTSTSTPPSSRKRERIPSFSGLRRLSFSEQSELPKQGLGLGITKSPPSKQPVIDIPSQDPVLPTKRLVEDSESPCSAPIPRWGSKVKDHLTSSKSPQVSGSPDITKPLPSAMRSNSTRRRPSEPPSVSFREVDVADANPASTMKSTAQKILTSSAKTQDHWKEQCPPGMSPEQYDKFKRNVEADAKLKRKEAEELEELEEKIRELEFQKLEGPYLRKSKEMAKALKSMIKNRGTFGTKTKKTFVNSRNKYERLQQERSKFEDPSKTASTEALNDNSPSTRPIECRTVVNSKDSLPKNGAVQKLSTLENVPEQALSVPVEKKKASHSNQVKAASLNASRSIGDPELPAMKQKPVQRAFAATRPPVTTSKQQVPKGPSPEEPIVISESESDSTSEDSDEDSDSEDEGQPSSSNPSTLQQGKIAITQDRSKESTLPSQNAPSPVWPRLPTGSQTKRPSLKSMKADQKRQQQEQTQSKGRNAERPRRGIFDGPSDSDVDNSESEASGSSSASDSESSSESSSESDSESSSGSGSERGDIQSSGRVDKLSPRRR